MALGKIRIDTGAARAANWRIFLEDQDISRFVRGLTIEARAGKVLPRVNLDLVGFLSLPRGFKVDIGVNVPARSDGWYENSWSCAPATTDKGGTMSAGKQVTVGAIPGDDYEYRQDDIGHVDYTLAVRRVAALLRRSAFEYADLMAKIHEGRAAMQSDEAILLAAQREAAHIMQSLMSMHGSPDGEEGPF